jgi:outer membrane protein OmpU
LRETDILLKKNKLTKMGVSALCGSLAGISAANAGDLSASGGADLTWISLDDAVTGAPIGMGSNFTLSGSGELDNGWNVSLSIAMTNANAYSNTNVTVGIPGLGDVRIDQGTSGTGIDRYDDASPTVWEEADGAGLAAGIDKVSGTSAGPTIEVTPGDMVPAGLTARFAWSPDPDGSATISDKGSGGSSGVAKSGWDLVLEAGSDLHGMDGLTVYGGISEVEQFVNSSAYSGDREETVLGFKYAMGGFTVGYQITDEETGMTTTTGYENTSYGITFSVNDDLSIGYNHIESDESGQGKVSPEADSFQAAYTMGGATFRLAEVDVDNSAYAAGSSSATVISLGLAF